MSPAPVSSSGTPRENEKEEKGRHGARGRVLVGNSFPLSLIRREVVIRPVQPEAFLAAVRGAEIFSFWGHAATIGAVRKRFGVDVTPREERPALTLSEGGLPELYGEVFRECWILSPVFRTGYRPPIGEEAADDQILSWRVLHMVWR